MDEEFSGKLVVQVWETSEGRWSAAPGFDLMIARSSADDAGYPQVYGVHHPEKAALYLAQKMGRSANTIRIHPLA